MDWIGILICVGFVAVLFLVVLNSRGIVGPLPGYLKKYFDSNTEYRDYLARLRSLEAELAGAFDGIDQPTADDVIKAYSRYGLDTYAVSVEALKRWSATLTTTGGGASVGESKVGGSPDLPDDVPWPQRDGVPLSFLVQLNLEEIPVEVREQGLPQSGMLYFFYNADEQPWGFDPKDRDQWAVLYTEAAGSRRANPDGLIEEAVFPESALTFTLDATIPEPELWTEEGRPPTIEESKASILFGESLKSDDAPHRLLGYPDQIQGDMTLECQLASNGVYCGGGFDVDDPRIKDLISRKDEWRLLLQIASDDKVDMMWGDVGCLYFWIREDDLRQRRFDQVWLVLQCH